MKRKILTLALTIALLLAAASCGSLNQDGSTASNSCTAEAMAVGAAAVGKNLSTMTAANTALLKCKAGVK